MFACKTLLRSASILICLKGSLFEFASIEGRPTEVSSALVEAVASLEAEDDGVGFKS